MLLDTVINLVPAVSVVYGWMRSLFSTRLVSFLLFKAIFFFIAYKYLPLLFGRFYQWIYNVGLQNLPDVDLSSITGFSWPQIAGLAAWLIAAFRISTVFNILISGAVVRLLFSRLPFMGR